MHGASDMFRRQNPLPHAHSRPTPRVTYNNVGPLNPQCRVLHCIMTAHNSGQEIKGKDVKVDQLKGNGGPSLKLCAGAVETRRDIFSCQKANLTFRFP